MSEVFLARLKKGPRTYFFDIKQNEKRDFYMTITESKKSGDKFDKYRIMIYEEDIQDFADFFQNTLMEFMSLASRDGNTI